MNAELFELLGATVTALEAVAFLLAVGCVACNIRELHWGWPLSIASSLLYGWLFAGNRLYGEAALQGLFVGISVWGWWQWLRGRGPGDAGPLRIRAMAAGGRVRVLAVWGVGALALATALARWTDSDVPFLDALPTAGSVLGQWMLARKYLENWWVWIAVNALSVLLFGWKGLWLTALLYTVLTAMAVAGLRAWRARLARERGLAA